MGDDKRERALWAAVLIQAIEDVNWTPKETISQAIKQRHLHEKEKAKAYLKAKRAGIGSFLWICELFDIDPDKVREAIFDNNGRCISAGLEV